MDTRFTIKTRHPLTRVGHLFSKCAVLLHSDLDVVALDLYAVETDFTVGLQSIESGLRIRLYAGKLFCRRVVGRRDAAIRPLNLRSGLERDGNLGFEG